MQDHAAKSLMNVYKQELLQPVRDTLIFCLITSLWKLRLKTNSLYPNVLCLLKAFNTYIALTGCTSSPLAWKSSCLLLDYFVGWFLFELGLGFF